MNDNLDGHPLLVFTCELSHACKLHIKITIKLSPQFEYAFYPIYSQDGRQNGRHLSVFSCGQTYI